MNEKTWQERMVEWRNSDSLFWRTVGTYLKFIFEYVSSVLFLAIPVMTVGYFYPGVSFEIAPIPNSIFVILLGMALTVTGVVWCFSG